MRMNRKVLALLIVLIIMVFALPVGALAEECGCGLVEVQGAEKHKIVSDLLKNDAFKAEKKAITEQGFKWTGVSKAEVVRTPDGDIFVAIPVTSPTGENYGLVYVYGQFHLVPESI